MAAPSSTQPSTSYHTYGTFVNGIITHRSFPLIIKKAFDTCQSNAFDGSRLAQHFTDEEDHARLVQNFVQQHGITATSGPWTSIDLFMSVLVASFNQVRSTGAGANNVLRDTIAHGQRALVGVWTDPQYIGDTDTRRVPGEVQSSGHGPSDDIAPRPSVSREFVSSAQRSEEQPSSGTQTGRATARKALSDKAKQTLDRWFREHISDPYPSKQEKEQLAAECGIDLSSVNNWFGNKRMRVKRKMLPVKSQRNEEERITDKVLAPKSKWNAVVVSKMECQAGRDALESATGASVPVNPVEEGGRNGHSVVKRGAAGPSVAPHATAIAEQVGESSDIIHPQRSRRKEIQPRPSTLSRPEKASEPEPPPLRDNICLPREGHLFPSQPHVGLPVLPRSNAFTGQVQNGIEAYGVGQALPSRTQAQTSGLPSAGVLTARIRDGAEVYREGQHLPPIGSSILRSIAVNTEEVQNNSAQYRGGYALAPHSLGGMPTLQATVLTEGKEDSMTTCREKRTMRTRPLEGSLNVPSASQIPRPSFVNAKPQQNLTQQAREHTGRTSQLPSERGPFDTENAVQDNRGVISAQTRLTERTQLEDQEGQAGPSRSTRKTKRCKLT